ncbi:MAG: GAF domain-containing protein, partial [Actinomycetota bacterium]|nr:GAF domain-containing protein [Actinomycetota bacterium]
MPLFPRHDPAASKDLHRAELALEAALRVSEIAASATALPISLRAMVSSAMELLAAEQGSIMLLEERDRALVLVASYGLPTTVPNGYRLPVGESVAGRVLATGKPLLLGRVDRDAFVNFVPKSRPIVSSIVVPLRIQGKAIGVLSLAISTGEGRFTDEDMRVAQMFADQAASVLHRARLHEQAEHRSSDLLALLEASRGLLDALDVDSLLQ